MKNTIKTDRYIVVLAVLFTIISTVSRNISPDSKEFLPFEYFPFLGRFVLFLVIHLIWLTVLFAILDHGAFLRTSKKEKDDIRPKRFNWKAFGIISLILAIIWAIYCYFLLPSASIPVDAIEAYKALNGLSKNTNNPLFIALLYNAVLSNGFLSGHFDRVVFLYSALQTVAFILVLAYSLTNLIRREVPLYFVGASMLALAFPIVPVYAFGMIKDSIVAIFLLLFINLIMDWIDDPNQFSVFSRKTIVVIFCVAILPGLRNGMAWLITVTFIPIFLWSRKEKNKGRWMALTCLLLGTLSIILVPIMHKCIMGHETMIRENLSIPLQQIGRIYSTNNGFDNLLSNEEQDKLNKVIPEEAFALYKAPIADPIKNQFKEYPSNEEMNDFWMMYINLVHKNPKEAIKAFILMNCGYYSPTIRTRVKEHLLLGGKSEKLKEIDPRITENQNTDSRTWIKEIDKAICSIPVIGSFGGIGLYFIILITFITYYIRSRGPRIRLVPTGFLLLFFVGCCFSPVNGYYRYAFPVIVSTPAAILMLFYPADGRKCLTRGCRFDGMD